MSEIDVQSNLCKNNNKNKNNGLTDMYANIREPSGRIHSKPVDPTVKRSGVIGR